ncbi:hypothetical protein PLANTIT3_20056 [Plantibacter sp. T3]|nr:hypothetical protein PLANTIT3_20056 [Plantibacter sp. T3]
MYHSPSSSKVLGSYSEQESGLATSTSKSLSPETTRL